MYLRYSFANFLAHILTYTHSAHTLYKIICINRFKPFRAICIMTMSMYFYRYMYVWRSYHISALKCFNVTFSFACHFSVYNSIQILTMWLLARVTEPCDYGMFWMETVYALWQVTRYRYVWSCSKTKWHHSKGFIFSTINKLFNLLYTTCNKKNTCQKL